VYPSLFASHIVIYPIFVTYSGFNQRLSHAPHNCVTFHVKRANRTILVYYWLISMVVSDSLLFTRCYTAFSISVVEIGCDQVPMSWYGLGCILSHYCASGVMTLIHTLNHNIYKSVHKFRNSVHPRTYSLKSFYHAHRLVLLVWELYPQSYHKILLKGSSRSSVVLSHRSPYRMFHVIHSFHIVAHVIFWDPWFFHIRVLPDNFVVSDIIDALNCLARRFYIG